MILCGGSLGTRVGGQNARVWFGPSNGWSTANAEEIAVPMPVSGVVNDLRVRIDDNFGGGTYKITVERSSGTGEPVQTSIECSIQAPTGSSPSDQLCSDHDDDPPHFNDGDRLTWRVSGNGQSVARRISMCVTFRQD